MVIVVMGVSGSGKTTLGRMLAARLGYAFIDADDHHPAENVAKMAAGMALEDADRWPWLERLNAMLRQRAEHGGRIVLACSALKQAYRDRLCAGLADCRLVYLRGSIEQIRARLAERRHRYMPASLLESQFAALEPPSEAITVDVSASPDACVAAVAAALDASAP
ncbi:MAG: gluconokinase [Burkholderiales bacterium]|nr:gluconokinase [Burkholderiales bacterium]